MKKTQSKMGRPKVEEKISLDRIKLAYQSHGTMKATAKALFINVKTLRRIFAEHNIPKRTPSLVDLQKYGAMSRREGCVAKWLKANPGAKLPASVKEISRVTGCSLDATKCYFKRRKDAVKEVLKKLPDLKTLNATLEDTLGYFINTKEILTYQYKINKYSCDVHAVVTLLDGTVTEVHIESIGDFVNQVKELLK